MPPKKKVVSKKAVLKTIEDMPNVTVRRPIVNDVTDDEIKDEENDAQMNVTVVLGEVLQSVSEEIKSPEPVIGKEGSGGKKAISKKVAPKKPKTKKPSRDEDSDEKGTVNEDFQTIKVENKVKSKGRKRPVEENAVLERFKSVSPIVNEKKRNRRAASVDVVPGGVTTFVNIKAVTEELVPKRTRKGVKTEEIKVEKKVKTKKVLKKTEEKGNLLIQEKDNTESKDVLQGKTEPKGGVMKEQTDEQKTEDLVDAEKVLPKQASRIQGASKNKPKQVSSKSKPQDKSPQNSEESSEKRVSEDFNFIAQTPEIKKKRVRKGKVNKSLEELEEKITDDDLGVAKVSNIKSKRACKGRLVVEGNGIAEKNTKLPKRGGRKGKVVDFEGEVMQKSPPVSNIEQNFETGDLPDGFLDDPESGKNENRPVAAKRKTKAKK